MSEVMSESSFAAVTPGLPGPLPIDMHAVHQAAATMCAEQAAACEAAGIPDDSHRLARLVEPDFGSYQDLASALSRNCHPDLLPSVPRLCAVVLGDTGTARTLNGDQRVTTPCFHHGDLLVKGDLDVVAPFVVTGSLTVEGVLADCGPDSVVVIGGGVTARGVFTDGEMCVLGDIEAEIVYGHYNDNTLQAGRIRARLVIEDEHATIATVEAGLHFDLDDYQQGYGDGVQEQLRELLVDETFAADEDEDDDEAAEMLDHRLLFARLREDLPVFRSSSAASIPAERTTPPPMEQTQMVHSPPGYRVITADEAEKRFRVSDDVLYPYADFADEQEIRLYEGGLHVAGHLAPEGDDDWVPYNAIVDGDLTVDGDLDWWDHSGGNLLVVTGSLRARNVILAGCPSVVVRGDLEVTGGICCSYGDDGGILTVGGSTRAQLLVSMLYFNLVLAEQPEALLVADHYRSNCPVDFDDDELPAILLPELLDDHGEADARRIEQALCEGRQVLRAGVRPSHLAALEELDALLDRAEEVTELDLSSRGLRAFPEQLLAFPRLRVLSLADNADLGRLDLRIGELTALEELDVSGTGLTELPASIGTLRNLRVLDISGNAFTTLPGLPESLGDLARLEVLRVSHLTCHLPGSLARLRSLRELDLSRFRQGPYLSDTPVELPEIVTRLTGLRSLDLSGTRLTSVPDTLLHLTELEELSLNGCLSAQVHRLPELARLPRLRVLRLSGHTPFTDQHPPSRDLLSGIWDITTLEHLEIDRWGKEVFEGNKVRKPFRALPDDAFARTPNLRHVDLSFNELTTLPEPFFALRHLEFAGLRYSRLDQPTRERLRDTFPHVRVDLRDTGTPGVDHDANWQAVHTLVRDGGTNLQAHDHQQAAAAFEEAIALCATGARYSDYDQLYAHYGLVDALGHLADSAPEPERPALTAKLVRYAEQALALIPGIIWHFTDEGAFQEEVKRRTGNALAWHLLRSGEPERALAAVEQALTVASAPEYDFIRDTQVRILLALGRTDDAYRVVDQVLTRDPSFGDFTDIAALPEFQSWRQVQRVHQALGGDR